MWRNQPDLFSVAWLCCSMIGRLLRSNHEVLSIEYFKMVLVPFVCLQFGVFSSCKCQKQTIVKQSTYCSFIEFEEELLSLGSDFPFPYFYTTTKAAHKCYETPTQSSDCSTKDSVHLVNTLNSVCVSLAGSSPRLIGQCREIFPVSSLEKQKMSDSHLDCAHSLNNTTKTIKQVGEWTWTSHCRPMLSTL